MVRIPCDYCGNPASTIVDSEGNCSCVSCYQKFYTCEMCIKVYGCEFETNPSPIPKVVAQTIRRGPAIMQTQVRNPQRVAEFCHKCQCWNNEESFCGREDGWCKNYHEVRHDYSKDTLPETPSSST